MPVNQSSAAREQDYQGVVLLGRYRVLRLIGRGGMASVWLAEHMQLGSQVAVKFTRKLDANNIARFHQEAQTSAQLNSPHIVNVHDVGVHEGAPFLVMELLEGESLAEHLLARGRLPASETLQIVSQVGRALRRAHERKVIHRDLKPSNLFLVAGEKQLHVKLLDFGAARVADSERTRTGDFVGTPHYMSPEQALDARQVGASADLWSLAMIVFQCLVGRRAIQGRNLALVLQALGEHRLPVPSDHAELPPAFDHWFERATRKDPESRFRDVEHFVSSLEVALDEENEALLAEDISLPLHSRSPFPHRSQLTIGLLVLVCFGAFVFLWGGAASSESSRLETPRAAEADVALDPPEKPLPPGAPSALDGVARGEGVNPKPPVSPAPTTLPPSFSSSTTRALPPPSPSQAERASPPATPLPPAGAVVNPVPPPAAPALPPTKLQDPPPEEEDLWGPRR